MKPNEQINFEKYLQDLYGKQIYLRDAPDGSGKSYSEVSSSVKVFCEFLANEVVSLKELLEVVRDSLPPLKNFREKDAVLIAISETASKFDFWNSPEIHMELKLIISKIGYPGQGHIDNVVQRDFEHDPVQILNNIKSRDPVKRNRGVRLLKLARVRNKFRPSAMAVDRFIEDLFKAYLFGAEDFSVESHVYIYLYLSSTQENINTLRGILKNKKNHLLFEKTMVGFLRNSAVSLHRLPLLYKNMLADEPKVQDAA